MDFKLASQLIHFILGSNQAMEYHRKKLDSVCRLGTDCVIDRRALSKLVFSEELELVYGIDVWSDDEDIHPPNVCNKHRVALNRVKKSLKENEAIPTISKSTPLVFTPHTDGNCAVCNLKMKKTAGRPPKSNRTDQSQNPAQPSNENLNASKLAFGQLNEEEVHQFLVFLVENLCTEQFTFLSYLLGNAIHQSAKASSISLRGEYKTIQRLSRHSTSDCINNANPALVCFLKAVSGLTEITDNKHLYHLARVIEGIYKLCDTKLITPSLF